MQLEDNLLIEVFSYAVAADLFQLAVVCKRFNNVASDRYLWEMQITQLWKDKVFVPAAALAIRNAYPKLAYRLSVIDSKRCFLTKQEIESIEWRHRFKECAGAYSNNIVRSVFSCQVIYPLILSFIIVLFFLVRSGMVEYLFLASESSCPSKSLSVGRPHRI